MSDLPSHPDDAGDGAPAEAEPVIAGMSRGRKAAVIAIVLMPVALMLALHLAGVVGKGSNG